MVKDCKMYIQRGKVYRVRVLNAGNLGYYNFAIADHNLTVVMAGGTLTEHVTMQSLDIGVAERYDFILRNFSSSLEYYRISIQNNYAGNEMLPAGYFDRVYLRYDMSTTFSPALPVNETKFTIEQYNQIKPFDATVLPNPTREIVLNVTSQYVSTHHVGQGNNTNGYSRWTVNEKGYDIGSTLYLLASYYNMMDNVHYTSGTKPFLRLEYGEVVEIVIQNQASADGRCGPHTWHMHGYDVFIVGTGPGQYNPATDKLTFTPNSAMALDTILLYPDRYTSVRNQPPPTLSSKDFERGCGWAAIRFEANNPSFWHFHCHIDWHMSVGMGFVVEVAPEILWDTWNLKLPSSYELCGVIDSVSNTPNPRTETKDSNDGAFSKMSFSESLSLVLLPSLVFICIIIGLVFLVLRRRRENPVYNAVQRDDRTQDLQKRSDATTHKSLEITITNEPSIV